MKLSTSLKQLRPQQLLKLLPISTSLVLVACAGALGLFLYQNFYQTITQARVVSVLRNQLALSQINVPLYQQVLTNLQNKKHFDASTISALKDPFQPLPPAPAAEPSLDQANTPPKP